MFIAVRGVLGRVDMNLSPKELRRSAKEIETVVGRAPRVPDVVYTSSGVYLIGIG